MASTGGNLHAQVWDDSALVDSWNDALDEYKKYHSVKARGESADELLKIVEEPQQQEGGGQDGQIDYEDVQGVQQEHDPHAKKIVPEETYDHDTTSAGKNQRTQVRTKHFIPEPQASHRTPSLPQALIGQVHDEGLKNLLMSWYYAGYYTGLYEGQQSQEQGKPSLGAKPEA